MVANMFLRSGIDRSGIANQDQRNFLGLWLPILNDEEIKKFVVDIRQKGFQITLKAHEAEA